MAVTARTRKIVILCLLNLAALIPAVLVTMFGQPGLGSPAISGAIVAAVGTLISVRLGVTLALAAGLAASVLTLVHPYPLLGGITFGLITAFAAYTARRGLHSAAMLVPIFLSIVLASPPTVSGVQSSVVAAALVGTAIAVGGLWVVLVWRVVLGSELPSMPVQPVGPRTSAVYASVAGVVVGAAAWLILGLDSSQGGAWLLVTLLVLLQPDTHDSWVKTWQRLAGTLLGGLLAIPVILLPLGDFAGLVVGVIFLTLALIVRYAMKRPYWQYVTPLTIGIVLMDSTAGDRERMEIDRLEATLAGAAVVILITLAIKAGITVWERAHREPTT
jgi:hypothetical protein